jgi:hypothetical protein
MTQCVVYIATPIRGQQHKSRAYINEAGSLGMHESFYEHERHLAPHMTLDSRVIRFPNPKAAEEFAVSYANSFQLRHDRDEVGYHGITENGNACMPFKVVRPAANDNIPEKLKSMDKHRKLNAAYSTCFLPYPITIDEVTVGRDGELEWDEMLGRIGRYIENMVEEESDCVHATLKQLETHGFHCTDIDEHEDSVNVHFSMTHPNGEVINLSATICAFNLWDEKGIALLKDLRKRNESDVGVA